MKFKFTEEVKALFTQYQKNIKVIKDESTLEMFTYILRKPNNQVRITNINKVTTGKFYIIRYNFNGNKIWCPILTIPPVPNKNELGVLERQLKIRNIKKILYAINFDYLPLRYKALLIDQIIISNPDRYNKNEDKIANGELVSKEYGFRIPWIYTFLKKYKKNYAITAYDISKIDRVYDISSTILQRFVFIDTYYINKRMMYETLTKLQNEKTRTEFSKKIKKYEEILKMYETDVEHFYESLRGFEKNLKLMENI